MPVNPNRSAPTSWIAGCPSTTSVDTTSLRRHSWIEHENREWECAVCECVIDESWFRTMAIADVITPTSLDVAVSMWIDHPRGDPLVADMLTCPRY